MSLKIVSIQSGNLAWVFTRLIVMTVYSYMLYHVQNGVFHSSLSLTRMTWNRAFRSILIKILALWILCSSLYITAYGI
jgi:hypothetical protein